MTTTTTAPTPPPRKRQIAYELVVGLIFLVFFVGCLYYLLTNMLKMLNPDSPLWLINIFLLALGIPALGLVICVLGVSIHEYIIDILE